MLRAVFFDFDYTLADSSAVIVECFNHSLAAMGLPAATPEAVQRTIGLSLRTAFVQLAAYEHSARCDEFVRGYLARADEIMTKGIVFFPEVPQVVAELRVHGLKLGIVSTKYRSRIEAVLERDGLRNYFDVVVGGEDVAAHKPDPEGLLKAVAATGVTPDESVYVGDTVTDAETAAAAGMEFIAVLSGVTKAEAFSTYKSLSVLEKLSDLPPLLATMSQAVSAVRAPR